MIILAKMQAATYAEYLKGAVIGYAKDNVASGRWPEAGSLERSREDFETSLPQGLDTPDNYLFEIRSAVGGTLVGFTWLAIQRSPTGTTGFVYDLEIKPGYRRQGHASQALEALESFAFTQGATSVGLHVFAFNQAAQALYEGSGYRVESVNMRKLL